MIKYWEVCGSEKSHTLFNTHKKGKINLHLWPSSITVWLVHHCFLGILNSLKTKFKTMLNMFYHLPIMSKVCTDLIICIIIISKLTPFTWQLPTLGSEVGRDKMWIISDYNSFTQLKPFKSIMILHTFCQLNMIKHVIPNYQYVNLWVLWVVPSLDLTCLAGASHECLWAWVSLGWPWSW